MAKGSQLSQMKAALNQAGLSRQPQSGKKRKRAAPEEKEKQRRADKLREIEQKLNPFDVKVTKVKHDVGGRRIVGTTGRPAASKQTGLEQRKKTLLKEYESKDRAGGFIDRRFGESNPTLTPEERMLERFTREQQRASKGAIFNLEDEDELTHYGQSLSNLDDFDNVGLGLDEEEDEDSGQIDRATVHKAHFGGFDEGEEGSGDEPPRKKSKAEVMAEVIAKSKTHKIERQAQQEEDENIRHELDEEFASIRSLLYAPAAAGAPPVKSIEDDSQDTQYDQLVRELAFDSRAKPKDRTKTEEELALEEKEVLEKAERRRVRRMNGESEESEDEREVRSKRKQRAKGGDDLEDDFNDEQWDGLGAGLGETAIVDGGESETEEGGEGSEEGSKEGSEEEEDDEESEGAEEVGSLSDDEFEAEEGDAEALVSSRRGMVSPKAKSKELPFTFPCPETHEEFLDIIEDLAEEDVPTVVHRIRTLHHPSLAEDNKFKLQALTTVLIDHILYITTPPNPRFTLHSSLMPHLFALATKYPIQSAQHFMEKLNLMHKNLTRGLSRGATNADAKTWPGLPELLFLRTVGQVWPTSDKNHHVVTPVRLLMGAYLGLSRVRTLQDLASGLFLCTLFLQYEARSKRFVPEAVNFLANSLLHLAPHRFKSASEIPGSFPCPDYGWPHCPSLTLTKISKLKGSVTEKPNLPGILVGTESGPSAQARLLNLTLDLLGQFANMYKSLEGFIELYTPIAKLLAGVHNKEVPAEIASKLVSLSDSLGRLLKFSLQARRPLALQAHKPIPIPTYAPRFEESSSNYLRNRDPDHERNEAAKLRNQYKQERKGAIRELRKDARFLAAEQQKKQKDKDKAYQERMKKVFGSIESERAEQKAMDREKAKEKRRSGRK